jgi:DNA repair exonuclease SbcCD ATPase subunit
MLTRIQITNLGPFETFDSGALPAVALIHGDNGAGKTGLLECLKWVGASGHDPDMIRGNAESGEVIVTTDTGAQLRAITTRKQTTRSWKPKGGGRWIPGREEIDKLYKAIAYDPLAFLALPPKKQAETLAELSPVKVSPEEMAEAVGSATPDGTEIPADCSATERIDAFRKAIYDSRRELNTGADTQEAHAGQLEASLSAAAPDGDWAAEAAKLTDEASQVRSTRTARHHNEKSAQSLSESDINADIDARIAALEVDRVQHISYSRTTLSSILSTIDQELQPEIDRITAALAVAQERARAQQQAEGTRRAIEAARKDAAAKRARSKVLTSALGRLDELKKKVAAGAPIPGVMFQDGRIVRAEAGGLVPLSRWNTASQYQFCLRLAMLLGGGFVCVDHLEAFTEANQQAIFEAAREYATEGVQFLFARVDPEGGALRISPVGQPPQEAQ